MPLVRAAKKSGTVNAERGPANLGDWGKWYPLLCEFLSSVAWPEGDARITGTVLLLFEEGTFKAWVNDRDGARTAFVSGRTPDDVLAKVEAGLGSDQLDWRTARGKGKGR